MLTANMASGAGEVEISGKIGGEKQKTEIAGKKGHDDLLLSDASPGDGLENDKSANDHEGNTGQRKKKKCSSPLL